MIGPIQRCDIYSFNAVLIFVCLFFARGSKCWKKRLTNRSEKELFYVPQSVYLVVIIF